jgi:hypothetical protein
LQYHVAEKNASIQKKVLLFQAGHVSARACTKSFDLPTLLIDMTVWKKIKNVFISHNAHFG